MNSLWTKGLKRGSQEWKDVQGAYESSAALRARLTVMLEMMLKEELDKKTSDVEYESPSWAYKQADSIGYARAVQRLINALEK